MISKTDIEAFSDGRPLFTRVHAEQRPTVVLSLDGVEQASWAWVAAWSTLWRLFLPPWLRAR